MAAHPRDLNGDTTAAGREWLRTLVAFFAYTCIVSLWVYRGALNGEFISDDQFYVIELARNHPLDWDLIAGALNPFSDLKYAIMNYAPLYLITSRVEWALFSDDTFGYHVVNVVFHSLNATLLVALLRSAKLDVQWALLGGLFFAFHPANVETVSWISQLRSILALSCALGALLALRAHPAIATALFTAGLLFKVSASFALPAAAGLAWAARRDPAQPPISLPWLAGWCVAFALYSYPQFSSFYAFGRIPDVVFSDAWEQARTMAAIGTRYLVMAGTSFGTSAFQEPAPVRSWADPWWLASLPIVAVLAWRLVRGVVRGDAEAAHWLGAAAAFAPVSQIFPFYFSVADRYLYFILPGLIAASLLWWQEFERGASARTPFLRRRWRGLSPLDLGLRIATVAMVTVFALRSAERAQLWNSGASLNAEAARNYPGGGVAHWVRAHSAFSRGDIDGGMRAFEGVIDTGYYRLASLFELPEFSHLHRRPEFIALRKRLAQLVLDDIELRATPTQLELRDAGTAQFFLGDYAGALTTFESALEVDGPYRDQLTRDIRVTRRALRATSGQNGE